MIHTFVISGGSSAQYPLRLLGLFAQRDLSPLSVHLRRVSGGFSLTIVQDDIDERSAKVLLEKMRAIPDTENVALNF